MLFPNIKNYIIGLLVVALSFVSVMYYKEKADNAILLANKVNYEQSKTLQNEMKRKLESVESEYSTFKNKEEPVLAQNESIRRILNANEQGKIYLALVEASPNSLSLDDLADIVGTSAVLIKPSLLALEDLEVIVFNPSTREIKLA